MIKTVANEKVETTFKKKHMCVNFLLLLVIKYLKTVQDDDASACDYDSNIDLIYIQ